MLPIGGKRGRSGKNPFESIVVFHVVKNKAGHIAVVVLLRNESGHAKLSCLGSDAGTKLNMDAAFTCVQNGGLEAVYGEGLKLAVTVIEDNSFAGDVVLAVFVYVVSVKGGEDDKICNYYKADDEKPDVDTAHCCVGNKIEHNKGDGCQCADYPTDGKSLFVGGINEGESLGSALPLNGLIFAQLFGDCDVGFKCSCHN